MLKYNPQREEIDISLTGDKMEVSYFLHSLFLFNLHILMYIFSWPNYMVER